MAVLRAATAAAALAAILAGCRATAPPPDPRTPRAEALVRAGDHGQAAALWFDIYLTSGRRDLDAGVAAAAAMLESSDGVGQAQNARALMTDVLSRAPDRADARRVMGAAQARIGDVDAALASYRRAAELAPADAAVEARIGELSARAGDVEGAIAALQRARALAPGDLAIAKDLGLRLLEVGRRDRAVELLEDALAADVATDAERLEAARALGARREVGPWMQRIVDRDPLHTEAQRRLGEALMARGRIAAGVAALEAAAQSDPGDVDALLVLARALDLSGDRARALTVLAHAEALGLEGEDAERAAALRAELAPPEAPDEPAAPTDGGEPDADG